MAHHAVRFADQFLAGETADLDKGVVDRGDDALGVGGRINELVVGQDGFDLGDRLVVAHGFSRLGSGCMPGGTGISDFKCVKFSAGFSKPILGGGICRSNITLDIDKYAVWDSDHFPR